MLFHFSNFSQCVVCMFGHNNIYKVTNLKVHSTGRYFIFFKSLFKNYNKRLVWTTQFFFPVFVLSQKKIPPTLIRMVGRWGESVVKHRTFQNRNPVLVFLYHCISDGNRLFSENFDCNFNFILPVMSDKAAFESGALFCVQRYRGNLDIYHHNSASCWQRINLHIYAAGHKSVGLWYK